MGRIVVLLGPPGCGKSTIGDKLERLGFRWRDWEPWILERWGSRERFLADKAASLAVLHRELLAFIDAEPSPAVIESTGLSDREFLDALQRDRLDTLVVRLDVSESESLRRVAERTQGRHLSDATEANRAVWRAFQELVISARQVDLVVDTESVGPTEAAAAILRLTGPVSG